VCGAVVNHAEIMKIHWSLRALATLISSCMPRSASRPMSRRWCDEAVTLDHHFAVPFLHRGILQSTGPWTLTRPVEAIKKIRLVAAVAWG